jgi:hypothetical protein
MFQGDMHLKMKRGLRVGLISGLTISGLMADVTYQQTTKFLGGSLVDMMKKMASMPMIGSRMKTAFQDQDRTVYVKGNKMASIGTATSTLFDLDAGTITNINNERQTYSTETFEEMRAQMEQMQQRMNKQSGGDIQFDTKVEKTGQTRMLEGQTANETVLTMTAKQATAAGQMVVKLHEWLVPPTPASREVAEFYHRFGEKAAFAMGGVSSPMLGQAAKGLAAAMKESFQQDGYPALTVTEVSGVSAPMGPMAQENADPNAPMIQTETATSHIVTGPVDDAKFSIPAGYKEEKRHR